VIINRDELAGFRIDKALAGRFRTSCEEDKAAMTMRMRSVQNTAVSAAITERLS
jgi:hypothetical protein